MAAGGGGAWKVAYADFITAMMALFMVLWILGQEQDILEHMQEYFRNPPSPWDRTSGKYSIETGDSMGLKTQGNSTDAFYESLDPSVIQGIIESFYSSMQIDANQAEVPPVEMVITSDGLRMIIYNREDSPMFDAGSHHLTSWGDFLVQNLSWLISRHGLQAVIEGHADPGMEDPNPSDANSYGPWELSMDRANTVRRLLQFYAGGDVDIDEVAGYGSQDPLPEELIKEGRTHQRISVALRLPSTEFAGN